MRLLLLLLGFVVTTCVAAELQAPPRYTVHDLGPWGGQIVVPEGWAFREGGTPAGPTYTLSRENNPDGNYDTGLRVQFFADIKKKSGMSAKQAVEANVQRLKATQHVVNECPPQPMAMFTKVCLETTGYPSHAKPKQVYRMVYTFVWNDDADLFIATTFGAPVEQWKDAVLVYDVIKDFKLLDLDRRDALAKTKATQPGPAAAALRNTVPAAAKPDPALQAIAKMNTIQLRRCRSCPSAWAATSRRWPNSCRISRPLPRGT